MEYTILETKEWVREHPDDLPARVVICHLPKNSCTPFSTHIQVDRNGELALFSGHYFSFIFDAAMDYDGRKA